MLTISDAGIEAGASSMQVLHTTATQFSQSEWEIKSDILTLLSIWTSHPVICPNESSTRE